MEVRKAIHRGMGSDLMALCGQVEGISGHDQVKLTYVDEQVTCTWCLYRMTQKMLVNSHAAALQKLVGKTIASVSAPDPSPEECRVECMNVTFTDGTELRLTGGWCNDRTADVRVEIIGSGKEVAK